jgi:uncharacterized RDD family membrane protein YckC
MQQYGGFWIRVLAYFIDYFIVNFATSVLLVVFAVGLVATEPSDEAAGGATLLFLVATLAVDWLYHAIMESSSWQGTVGKKGLNLVVARSSGERISFGRATGRYFAKILSALILLIGYFMVGWTQRKQGLHDLIADTVVYKAREPNEIVNSARVFE